MTLNVDASGRGYDVRAPEPGELPVTAYFYVTTISYTDARGNTHWGQFVGEYRMCEAGTTLASAYDALVEEAKRVCGYPAHSVVTHFFMQPQALAPADYFYAVTLGCPDAAGGWDARTRSGTYTPAPGDTQEVVFEQIVKESRIVWGWPEASGDVVLNFVFQPAVLPDPGL